MARRAVAAVVEDAIRLGVEYRCAQALNPREAGRVEQDIPVNHSQFFATVVQPTLSVGTQALVVATLAYLGYEAKS